LAAASDFECVGLNPLSSDDQIVTNDMGAFSRWQPKTQIGEIDGADQAGMVDLAMSQAKVGCRGPRTLTVAKSFRLPGCPFAPCLRRVMFICQSPPNMTPKFRQRAPL